MRKLIKGLVGAVVLSVAGAGVAAAADLPARMPAKAPAVVAPVALWTGFYIGLNAGGAWTSGDAFSSNTSGFVGGGQLGYNWQTGPLVLGIEGDFQGQSIKNSGTVSGITVEAKSPWFATLRGRIGYAWGPSLLYFTGGAAWANYKLTLSAAGVSMSDSNSKTGWTVGGGWEYMFAPKWSAKLEYLYIDSGNVTLTLLGVPLTARAKENVVRAGINYHF